MAGSVRPVEQGESRPYHSLEQLALRLRPGQHAHTQGHAEQQSGEIGRVAIGRHGAIGLRCGCSAAEEGFDLAEKTGKFLPADIYGRYDAIQWTFWQMGGLGPMAGQNHHFRNYAEDKIAYAIDRYVNETNRLYGVLNKRLADREFIAGQYSIADMACYPWVVPFKNQGQDIEQFPHVKRWLETIGARPATERAYAKAKEVNPNFGQPAIRTEEERNILFGQTAAVVR